MEQHGSVVPDNREALEALPGVGRKTANVVLNTAFRQPAMAVDTHIFRVSNRTGIAPGKNVLEVEKRLMRLVPREFLMDAHHWLRSEEHTSELQSRPHLVCGLLLEKKNE